MRLWLLGQVSDIENSLRGLLRVMVERAAKEIQYLMPGYTHLQVRPRSPYGNRDADDACQ